MKLHALVFAAGLAVAAFSTAALAKDLPATGMTAEDVEKWLQTEGYQAKIVTGDNGQQTITSASDGVNFHVGFYDCKGARCGSIQFYAGFDTKGKLDPNKMNEWNQKQRWARAYVDKTNDPWLEMDVDLTPGGTYELLGDEFATWRSVLAHFKTFIGF